MGDFSRAWPKLRVHRCRRPRVLALAGFRRWLGSGAGPVAVMVVGALLAAGCSGSPSQGGPTAQVQVSAGRSASLHLADGLSVEVPKDAVRGTGVLSGVVTRTPASAPTGMTLAGPVYRLHITGASLSRRVRLVVPVPAPSGKGATSGPDDALLAFFNRATHRWQPVAARYAPATRRLTAMTPHLSTWSVLRLDAGKVLSAAASLLKGFIGVAATTSQPSCRGRMVWPAQVSRWPRIRETWSSGARGLALGNPCCGSQTTAITPWKPTTQPAGRSSG